MMIFAEQVTIVFFRLINFGVLIGLGWYLAKKHLLPIIRQQLAAYVAYFNGLRKTHRMLKQEQRVIAYAIDEDCKEQAELKERVMSWKAQVHEHNEQLYQEREQRRQVLQKSISLQVKQVAQYRLYKAVMPEAMQEARRQLTQQFAQEGAQQRVLRSIITMMRDE